MKQKSFRILLNRIHNYDNEDQSNDSSEPSPKKKAEPEQKAEPKKKVKPKKKAAPLNNKPTAKTKAVSKGKRKAIYEETDTEFEDDDDDFLVDLNYSSNDSLKENTAKSSEHPVLQQIRQLENINKKSNYEEMKLNNLREKTKKINVLNNMQAEEENSECIPWKWAWKAK